MPPLAAKLIYYIFRYPCLCKIIANTGIVVQRMKRERQGLVKIEIDCEYIPVKSIPKIR